MVKIGAKVINHARYTVFQMAEVAVPRNLSPITGFHRAMAASARAGSVRFRAKPRNRHKIVCHFAADSHNR